MALRETAQEDTAGTYLEKIPYLSRLIEERLIPGQPEGITFQIWDEILHNVFPADEYYSSGLETAKSKSSSKPFTALAVLLAAQADLRKFLVVVCKEPASDRDDHAWRLGAKQLENHILSIPGGHDKWGAIAIGKAVRFYKWENDGLKDLCKVRVLHIDRHCQTAMSHFEAMKRGINPNQLWFRTNAALAPPTVRT